MVVAGPPAVNSSSGFGLQHRKIRRELCVFVRIAIRVSRVYHRKRSINTRRDEKNKKKEEETEVETLNRWPRAYPRR